MPPPVYEPFRFFLLSSIVKNLSAKVIYYSFGDWVSCGAIEIYNDEDVEDEFETGMRFVASSLINLRSAGYDIIIVTREILRDISEYDEEKYTSLSEMYEIDIHSDHTATIYARKRREEAAYQWTASGKSIVLLAPEVDEDNIFIEKKDASTVKMTFGEEDKYLLLGK